MFLLQQRRGFFLPSSFESQLKWWGLCYIIRSLGTLEIYLTAIWKGGGEYRRIKRERPSRGPSRGNKIKWMVITRRLFGGLPAEIASLATFSFIFLSIFIEGLFLHFFFWHFFLFERFRVLSKALPRVKTQRPPRHFTQDFFIIQISSRRVIQIGCASSCQFIFIVQLCGADGTSALVGFLIIYRERFVRSNYCFNGLNFERGEPKLYKLPAPPQKKSQQKRKYNYVYEIRNLKLMLNDEIDDK